MADLQEIPAIEKAVELERETRQDAWLEMEEPLCGVAVNPLTLRMVLILDLAKNWYIAGKPADAGGLESIEYLKDWQYNQAAFLWVASPRFKPGDFRRRDRFFKTLRKQTAATLHLAITQFVETAFFDSPEGGPENHSAPVVDWVASMVHQFAASYGWTENKILDTSLRKLLQLRRCIRLDLSPDSTIVFPNPLSDAAKAQWLDSLESSKSG